MYHSVAILQKLEDALDNMIGGPVGTTSLPPTLNDPTVVSIYGDVVALS